MEERTLTGLLFLFVLLISVILSFVLGRQSAIPLIPAEETFLLEFCDNISDLRMPMNMTYEEAVSTSIAYAELGWYCYEWSRNGGYYNG